MTKSTPYDSSFFSQQYSGSLRSARNVAPIITALYGVPRSVVDVGGGLMPWLEALGEVGASELYGLDSVPEDMLPASKFSRRYQEIDLNLSFTLPSSFDLALCLEVGEHLAPSSADNLVRSLASLSSIIVFSAAVPGQGGTGHINEQWQSWWASKFQRAGFWADTRLRDQIWDNESVNWWYRQNTIVYQRYSGKAPNTPQRAPFLDVVHPGLYAQLAASESWSDVVEGTTSKIDTVTLPRLKKFITKTLRLVLPRRALRKLRKLRFIRRVSRILR